MFRNVVIGKPIVDVESLLATDKNDWETNEKKDTLFTRYEISSYGSDRGWNCLIGK